MEQFDGNPVNYHYFVGTVYRSCKGKNWGAQRKTDTTDKIYN